MTRSLLCNRDAGANKVYFASASPPVRYSNVYGIDMPTQEELIAFNRTEEEVAEYLGADMLIYQDLEDLKSAIKYKNPEIKDFEASVFDGHYVTANIDSNYLRHLHDKRSDEAKNKSIYEYEVGVETQNLI